MTRRELLRASGLSLTDLARKAGVSRQLATDTVDGVKSNKKVLRELEKLGGAHKGKDHVRIQAQEE